MADPIARRTLAYLKRLDEEQNARGAVVDARPKGQEAQALQPDAEDATVRMRIPTDAWRVIIDFAAPAKVTRHIAARAETLDEFVRRELENKPDEWNETLCVKHAVTHTRTRLDLLNTLRLVATEWRTLVDYDSESTRQLALPTDLHINFDSDDVRARFRNCEILTIDGDAHQSTATWDHLRRDRYDEFPDVLWHTRRLRSLSLYGIAPPSPLIRGDLPLDHLVELSIEYPLGEKNYTDVWRAWESDPNALPRTLEVLNFGHTPDVSLECIRLLPRLRELRLGQRNQKRPDIVPGWFHGLRSLRRFEVHIAKPTDWAAQLCDLSLEAVSFSSDYLEEAEDQFLASLNVMANGALGSSLRKFKLDGYQDLTRAPDVVSLFPNLQHLDLRGNFLIETGLPEELGQLPLVVLDLSYTKVRTLPASLRGTKTLKLLYLLSTAWLSGPLENWEGDIVLQAGSLADPAIVQGGLPYMYLSLADAADEIARRDAILRPLSLALPDLRIRTHGDDVALANASMRWWHARCGWHWADPEFYYDTLGVRSD